MKKITPNPPKRFARPQTLLSNFSQMPCDAITPHLLNWASGLDLPNWSVDTIRHAPLGAQVHSQE
ncbi:hypothetical protein [Pseudomonas brassicacearum]|uniref:hypothetical protein n=1 Tax=Pseudomonas brassicacearum TaxID=930166 RepID=UPI0011CD80DD|nr:hypothetical protein [Pseudomonas brassicacearum]